MASSSTDLSAELESLAAPYISSGEFTNVTEVLHAAMDALREALRQKAYDEACLRAAEEGEASGIAEGNPFDQIRQELGLRPRKTA